MAFDDYATVADVRAEGLPGDASTDITDAKVQELLLYANQLVEKITKQFFVEKTGTLTFDGTNTHILHLPFPVHTVTSLLLNQSTDALDTSYYKVYDNRGGSDIIDDRKNPKIELTSSAEDSIYTKLDNRNFYKGYQQSVTGTWGYVESDGTTPIAIKRAVITIVMLYSQELYETFGTSLVVADPATGAVRRERTDDHEVEFYQAAQHTKNFILPLNVQNILMQYRAPNTVRVVGTRWVGDV